jgi:hypothetical protein
MEHIIRFDEKILNGKDNPDREKTCKELKLYAESSFNQLEEELQRYSPKKIGQDQEFSLYYGFRRLLNLDEISMEFEDTPLESFGLGRLLLHYDQPRLREDISRKDPFDKSIRQKYDDITSTVPFKEYSREDSVLLRHARIREKGYLGEGARLLHVSAPFGFCSDSYLINKDVPPILASALFEAVAYAVINYDLFFGDIYLDNLEGYKLEDDVNSTYQNALITVSNEIKFSPERLVEAIRRIGTAVLDLSRSEDYISAIRELNQEIQPKHDELESEIRKLEVDLYRVREKRHKMVEKMHKTVIKRVKNLVTEN